MVNDNFSSVSNNIPCFTVCVSFCSGLGRPTTQETVVTESIVNHSEFLRRDGETLDHKGSPEQTRRVPNTE